MGGDKRMGWETLVTHPMLLFGYKYRELLSLLLTFVGALGEVRLGVLEGGFQESSIFVLGGVFSMSMSNHGSCATSSNKTTSSSDDPSNIPTGVVGYVLDDGCEDTDVYCYASGVGVDTDRPTSDTESGDILSGVNPRYQLTVRNGSDHLILGIKEAKRWKEDFFFVPFDALGLSVDRGIPHSWSPASRIGLPFSWVCGQAPGRVDQVLRIVEEERYWNVLLSDSSLRDSTLWDHVPRQPEGISHPKNRAKSQVTILQRSLEILGCEPLFLPELTSDGRDFADRFMAQSFLWLVTVLWNVYAHANRRLGRLRVLRRRLLLLLLLLVLLRGLRSRITRDRLRLSRPIAAAHSEFGLHLGEASKLLFPEDRARFENIGEIASMELSISRSFQGMQGLMYALDKIKNMKEKMKDMRTELDTLRGEIKELKSCKKELDRVREELRTQLDAKEQDSNRLKSALADLATVQARVDMLEGRLAEIGLEAEIQCRGKMAMEYRDNKAESWDIPQYIADYEELLRMRAEEDARTSQLANSFEEMTTNDLPELGVRLPKDCIGLIGTRKRDGGGGGSVMFWDDKVSILTNRSAFSACSFSSCSRSLAACSRSLAACSRSLAASAVRIAIWEARSGVSDSIEEEITRLAKVKQVLNRCERDRVCYRENKNKKERRAKTGGKDSIEEEITRLAKVKQVLNRCERDRVCYRENKNKKERRAKTGGKVKQLQQLQP
ncbi:hypothetical protein F8388_019431 [Cannabis sativa]|uniref:Uncharacterized protein n=1 Tax=Cannabis sativa TaxID=3483 RepID=A0A7J6FFU5_CANSA|nr:hypothetical protein F8388_019431 [Cannabis sativa]